MAKNADSIERLPRATRPRPRLTEAPAAAPRPALNVAGAAVGRRKQAIARVRLVPGSGIITVNGRALADYFPNKLHQQLINDPFKVLELAGAYDVIARITGGGPSGQAGALRLGIARSLNEIDARTTAPPSRRPASSA